MAVSAYFRPVVRDFQAYSPSPTKEQWANLLDLPVDQIVKLDSGENVAAEKLNISTDCSVSFARYPDPMATDLRQALASYAGVADRQIVVCNGSDECIDLLCRLFLDQGDELVDFPPTFPMYTIFGKLAGATIKQIPRNADYSLPLSLAKRALAGAKLAFLATPNNPTGTVSSLPEIEMLLKTGVPLVVDEAYFEYCGQTASSLLPKYDNLIIIRTLSKWAGLAGLRIGYVIASPVVIDRLVAIKPPYNTSTFSQIKALRALRQKDEYLQVVADLKREKKRLESELKRLPGIRVIPSEAPLLTILLENVDAKLVAKQLRDRGVIVKVIDNAYLPNALRLNVSVEAEMDKLLSVLNEVL